MAETRNTLALAWAGWQVRTPRDWRPLDVTGGWRAGKMMIGDAERALLQVKWWRPGRRLWPSGAFDPQRWVRRRLRRAAGRSAEAKPAEAPAGFTAAASVIGSKSRGPGRWLWCGYAPEANLALELVTRSELPARQRRTIDRAVLPSLRVSPPAAPTRWAVFGASFVAPAGLVYRTGQLNLGDIALYFGGPGRRLLLRQVYPAPLALARRGLETWLDNPPRTQRRKFRPDAPPREKALRCHGRDLPALVRSGRKRLPLPLGFVAPRWTVAAAAVDERLERLLLAECDGRGRVPDHVATDAIAAMNWARWEEASS